MSLRRPALALALFATGACTDSNLTTAPVNAAAGAIVFASDREDRNFELWRVGGDGRGLLRLTRTPEVNDLAPALSRDGRRVAWEREVVTPGQGVTAVEIWVMNADGSDPRVVVSNGAENRSPSWGADDRSLVYSSFVGGDFDVWQVALDAAGAPAGAPVNLTRSPFADQWPRVAPDGATIVFQTNRDYDFEIYAMDADGGAPRNLTNSAADDRFPAWAPDGRTVVWSRFADGFDVWAMAADGSSPRAVTATPYDELAPSVSPDGRDVVFQSTAAGSRAALFVAPLAGGTARPLGDAAAGDASAQAPWWGPAP
jgi:Tol biopolymer transport system component